MKETRFYICNRCGNIVQMINDSGVNPVCCGEKMTELIAGTVEASLEKHVPVVTVEGNTVKVEVGSVIHPMTEEHSITWIWLQTDKGGVRRDLTPGSDPVVTFSLGGEKPVAVYAYCNLHGLWKTDVK